jgi:hypothetical protein
MEKAIMLRSILVIFTASMLIGGCSATYRHGSQSFSTPQEALAAQQAEADANLPLIKVHDVGFNEPAIVYIPTKAHVLAHGVVTQGNAAASGIADYTATHGHQNLNYVPLSIDRSRIFSSVETRQIDGFDQPPAPPGTHVVWMQLIDPNTGGWKYFNATMGTPVEIISNATGPAGADRVNAWIDALVTTVERNGGRLSTRTGAGAAPAANQTQPTATGNQPSGVTRTVN